MESFATYATTLSPLPSSLKPRFSLFNPNSNPNRNNLRFHRCSRRPISAVHSVYGGAWGMASGSQSPASARRGAETDVMGLLLQDRTVFLGTSIDDFVADAIISQLLLLDAVDPTKDIRLFINSSGGSLSASMAIFDVVRLIRSDVSTVALGNVTSTASMILGGGTKGKRLSMPNTRIMIHQPLGGVSGTADEVELLSRELMQNKYSVTQIISEFSGRPVEQVEKDIDRDNYMSPIEAVEFGIIDGVIDRDSIIPVYPVPDKVAGSIFVPLEEEDVFKFVTPEIPDDEIY